MAEFIATVRKRGKSLGFIIPAEIVRKNRIGLNKKVTVFIQNLGNQK